jgi:HNH endonuclease
MPDGFARARANPAAGPTLKGVSLDEIIDRDGARCAWCGAEPWRRDLTLEHVLPRSGGGVTTGDNALVACRACNRRRGSKPVVAYVRALRDDGTEPQLPVIHRALARMSESERRRHREYGARQLDLLGRL